MPVIEGVLALVEQNKSAGMKGNLSYFGGAIEIGPGVPPALAALLFDPQTSGGLLLAMAPGQAALALDRLVTAGVPAVLVGGSAPKGDKLITVR